MKITHRIIRFLLHRFTPFRVLAVVGNEIGAIGISRHLPYATEEEARKGHAILNAMELLTEDQARIPR